MFRQYGPATMRQGMAVINQVQQLSSLLPSFLGGVLYAMFGIRLMMIITIRELCRRGRARMLYPSQRT